MFNDNNFRTVLLLFEARHKFRIIHKVIIKHRHKKLKEKTGTRYCLKT